MTKLALFACALLFGCNALTGIGDYGPGAETASSLDDGETVADSPSLDALSVDATEDSLDGDSSVDGDAVDVSEAPTFKRVFVTSEAYTADLGGLAGADAKCQKLADSAKLGGTYRAWLSDSTTSAKTRLAHATVPYKLVDGTTIAADWSDLASPALLHAIDLTEKGGKPAYVSDCGADASASVWSNTSPAGDRMSTFSCENWTSKTATSPEAAYYVGRSDKADHQWTSSCGSRSCWSSVRTLTYGLYCFEQ